MRVHSRAKVGDYFGSFDDRHSYSASASTYEKGSSVNEICALAGRLERRLRNEQLVNWLRKLAGLPKRTNTKTGNLQEVDEPRSSLKLGGSTVNKHPFYLRRNDHRVSLQP